MTEIPARPGHRHRWPHEPQRMRLKQFGETQDVFVCKTCGATNRACRGCGRRHASKVNVYCQACRRERKWRT